MPTSPATRASPEQESRSGYVLFEVLLAMAIIAMMASLSLPLVSANRSATALQTKAIEATALLRSARNDAARSGLTVAVQVDARRGMIASPAASFRVPREVAISLAGDDQAEIQFRPDGKSTGGRLTLRSPAGLAVIDVNPTTSEVVLVRR